MTTLLSPLNTLLAGSGCLGLEDFAEDSLLLELLLRGSFPLEVDLTPLPPASDFGEDFLAESPSFLSISFSEKIFNFVYIINVTLVQVYEFGIHV